MVSAIAYIFARIRLTDILIEKLLIRHISVLLLSIMSINSLPGNVLLSVQESHEAMRAAFSEAGIDRRLQIPSLDAFSPQIEALSDSIVAMEESGSDPQTGFIPVGLPYREVQALLKSKDRADLGLYDDKGVAEFGYLLRGYPYWYTAVLDGSPDAEAIIPPNNIDEYFEGIRPGGISGRYDPNILTTHGPNLTEYIATQITRIRRGLAPLWSVPTKSEEGWVKIDKPGPHLLGRGKTSRRWGSIAVRTVASKDGMHTIEVSERAIEDLGGLELRPALRATTGLWIEQTRQVVLEERITANNKTG